MKDKIKNFIRRVRAVATEKNPGSEWNLSNGKRLEDFARNHFNSALGDEHGPKHWKNVERFGEWLWMNYNADIDVIQAFAFLHDIERQNNLDDFGHGPRAALLVDHIRDTVLWHLGPRQIRLLKKACRFHTLTIKTSSITVNACFDADRLDLPRYGIEIDPKRLATKYAKKICKADWFKEEFQNL